MMDRLSLQNSHSNRNSGIKLDFGKIFCCDDADFLRKNEKPFYHNITLGKIKSDFEMCSIVLLTGSSGTGKSYILRRFAEEICKKHKTVIFSDFDKDRYLFTDSINIPDDSFFFKKCLTRIFTVPDTYTKEYSTSYFLNESAEELLLKTCAGDSYIIVDSVDTPSVPEYVYKLSQIGFKVLISSNTFPKYDDTKITEIRHIPTFPHKAFGSGNDELFSLFNYNPAAIHYAQRFMKEFKFTSSQLIRWIKSIADHTSHDNSDFIEVFYNLASLTPIEKEIFITVGLLLFFNGTGGRVYKSKTEIYTNEIRSIICGNINAYLGRLIRLGFIGTLSDNSLYMDRSVMRFIVNVLKPGVKDCPCLMRKISQFSDFTLLQNQKDLYGIISAYEKDNYSYPTISENLLDIYCYFAPDDSMRCYRIYNLLLSYSLTNLGIFASHRYTGHLIWRNKGYMTLLLYDAMSSESINSIYKSSDTKHEYFSYYSYNIRAKLDIIRICISLIRFSSYEHLEENRCIYTLITSILDQMYEFSLDENEPAQYRAEVLCDVIRLCEETFLYFSDIPADGNYLNNRCRANSVTGYFYTDSSENLSCNSINILQDVCVFRLYASFQRLADQFTKISVNITNCEVLEYFKSLLINTKLFVRDFSVFYNRLLRGFDTFFDFYAPRYQRKNVYKAISRISDRRLEEMLSKARFFLQLGFDHGEIQHAQVFANQIIFALGNSRNIVPLLNLVTDSRYPISSYCRTHLINTGFMNAIFKRINPGSQHLAKLYFRCAEQLALSGCHNDFYEKILSQLFSYGKINNTTHKDASIHLCYFYIKQVCHALDKLIEPKHHTISQKDIIRIISKCNASEMFIEHKIELTSHESAEIFIANAIIRFISGISLQSDEKKSLKEAFLTIIYGRLHSDSNISRNGFCVLIKTLCTKSDFLLLLNKMIEFDLSRFITPEQQKKLDTLV